MISKMQPGFIAILVIIMLTLHLPVKAQNDGQHTSQYLFSSFGTARVINKSGRNIEAMMNYNCLTEEMVFVQNDKRMALSNLNTIDTVYLQNRIFIPLNDVFYELVFHSALDFLVQHKYKATSPGDKVGYGGTSQLSNVKTVSSLTDNGRSFYMDIPGDIEISDDTQFWIRKNDKMHLFYNRRTLAKIFPELKNEIKSYVKENNIDFKSREDLIDIVSYIDIMNK